MTEPASPSRRRRRRWPWFVVVGVLLLVTAGAAWLGLGLRSSASDISAHASSAQKALRASSTALTDGDIAGARAHVATAQDEIAAAATEAQATPVRVAGSIPVLGGAVADLDHMISAAGSVADATSGVVDVYDQVTGPAQEKAPIFSDGRVDLARLDALSTQVTGIESLLSGAQTELEAVEATAPGTASLASARDTALADLAPVRTTVERVAGVLPRLSAALGADGPKRYLVAILNEGEMRASGGAPLSVAVLAFNRGVMSIQYREAVTRIPWPDGVKLTWASTPGSPWNDAQGNRYDRFATANLHPDFRVAGRDMVQAWEAGGFPAVDGVVAIDVSGIAEVIRRTGPIKTPDYGTLTAANLGTKLLVDAYRDFADDKVGRKDANQVVVDVMFARLTSGDTLFDAVRGLGDAAPARHVQVYLTDEALQSEISQLGLDGSMTETSGDRVAVFSQNSNGSKVDVFQTRDTTVTADVAADGSATVTQRIAFRNDIPDGLVGNTRRIGYTTTRWRGAYYVYKPVGATDVTVSAKGIEPAEFVLGGGAWTDDGLGGSFTKLAGWVEPDASGTITLRYALPAGTFGSAATGLAYTLVADPQPIFRTATITLTVTGPDGTPHTEKRTVDRPQSFSVPLS